MDPKWNIVRTSSDSRPNFAWQLTLKIFTVDELKGKNCSGKCPTGGQNKKGALADNPKYILLHDIIFHWWPLTAAEKKKDAWRECIKAIDSGLRRTINKSDKSNSSATS